jgi:XTP/dITP diphosphohydrolase
MLRVKEVMTIPFVTTNTGKFQDVCRFLAEFAPAVQLEQVALDVPEIQSLDVEQVIEAKARAIWPQIQRPFLVDDGGVYLLKYHKFPGTMSKQVFEGIGLAGIWLLAQGDPRVSFRCVIAYCTSPNEIQYFEGRCDGKLVAPSSVSHHPQLPYTAIFVPEGFTKTMAEIRNTGDERFIHHRYKAIKLFAQSLSEN